MGFFNISFIFFLCMSSMSTRDDMINFFHFRLDFLILGSWFDLFTIILTSMINFLINYFKCNKLCS